jgi:hypothetical protein
VTRYLNWRGPKGRETVDDLSRDGFESGRAFRAELRRLVGEYGMAGMHVYVSVRPCANWRTP